MYVGSPPSWKDAVQRLRQIRQDDRAFVDAGLQTDRQLVRTTVAELFVRYIVTSNELTVSHDSIIQPQLRILIKRTIMCIYGRVLELKQILMDEDLSIYTPVTNELTNLKLAYDQFELRVPRYIRDERESLLNNVNKKIDEINNRIETEDLSKIFEENDVDEQGSFASRVSQSNSKETLESNFDAMAIMYDEQEIPLKFQVVTHKDIQRELAIKLIENYISAADDRKIVNELLAARRTKANIISGKYLNPSPKKAHNAAIKIQRYWRFYRIWQQTKARTHKKNFLIGMYMSNKRPNTDAILNVYDQIRVKQIEADAEFWKFMEKLQSKLDRYNQYEIIEEIEDELRTYIWTYFEICKYLPSWPDSKPIIFKEDDEFGFPPIILPDDIIEQLTVPNMHYQSALNQQVPLGGSAIFHTGRWMTIEMAKILATTITEYESKPAIEKRKLIKKFAEEKQKIKEKENKAAEKIILKKKEIAIASGGFVPEPSDLTEWFNEILYQYDTDWTIYDELDLQQPREELIKTEIFAKAQVELRAMVDNNIKNELIRLQIAYAQDLKKKYKPPKNKSKRKGGNKSKIKNPKSPEMIFEELVKSNMIKKTVFSEFHEFKGEISYNAGVLRAEPHNLDPPYGLGDVRQIIKELCVIGLSFVELRTIKQIKFISWLLIAGPTKSGKSMLTNAICTETGSLKIELTLQNISTNYPNIQAVKQLVKDIVMLVQVYQPVVIEIDLADVPFYKKKKIPNNLKPFKPELMQTVMKQLLKSLNPADRVIVVGKAISPWLSVGKKLSNLFNNVVFTVSDYNSVFILLHETLMYYPAINRTFPVTSLANMLIDYPRHVIIDIVAEVLNNERLFELNRKPLEPKEFIPVMMKYQTNSQSPKLSDQYYNWYKHFVPLGIKRTLKINQPKEVKKKK